MISIKNLYVSFTKEYNALHNVNLEVENGDKIAIVGDTESGKTTLLRVIAGLEEIKKGEVYVNNININKIDFKHDVSLAYVPKMPVFKNRNTVLENLQYVLKIRNYDMASINFKIMSVLNAFDIDSIKNTKIKNLNLYQKMLVQLARISLRKVDLFLIDNIVEGLDEKQQKDILSKLGEIIQNNPQSTFIITFTNEKYAKMLNLKIKRINNGSFEN